MSKKIYVIFFVLLGLTFLAGCSSQPSSVSADQSTTDDQLKVYENNQPMPGAKFSQYRQTVIDVEGAQIHGVATTSFFFIYGSPNPIEVCPSIGFPVASTAQLTNPFQVIWGSNSGSGVVGQAEPNGVYTGQSSGTYVVCVGPNGVGRIDYAEEDVHTVGAAAHWDKAQGLIVIDGPASVVSKPAK